MDAVTAWLLTDPSTDGSARPPPPAPVAAEGFKTRGEFVAALLARVKAECEGVLAGARRRPPPVLKCPLARHDTIPRASRPRPTRTIAPRAIFYPRAQTLTFIVRRRVPPRPPASQPTPRRFPPRRRGTDPMPPQPPRPGPDLAPPPPTTRPPPVEVPADTQIAPHLAPVAGTRTRPGADSSA